KLGEAGLFHNDLSAHNLWVLRDDRLVAIDFEQADKRSFIDPFAVMLWTIYDIPKKRNFSYDRGIYKRLYNDMGIERADKSYYPDFSAFSPPLWLGALSL